MSTLILNIAATTNKNLFGVKNFDFVLVYSIKQCQSCFGQPYPATEKNVRYFN